MANRSYFWGLTAILVYHLYQVNLLYNFDFDWCRQDASISQQQLRAPLPSSAAVDRGGSSTTTLITEPGGRRMQQYQLPSSRANFTCRISNVTYTFPQVPNFIVIGTQKGGTSALSASRVAWVLKSLVSTLSHHFPGRLHELRLLDLPRVLTWIVRGVKKLVHSETARKVQSLPSSSCPEAG